MCISIDILAVKNCFYIITCNSITNNIIIIAITINHTVILILIALINRSNINVIFIVILIIIIIIIIIIIKRVMQWLEKIKLWTGVFDGVVQSMAHS